MTADVAVTRVRTETDRDAWSAFLSRQAAATYGDSLAWRDVLVETYGFDDHLLLARRNGAVVGALGLYVTHSFLTGSHAISGPLAASGGGLHADDRAGEAALVAAAEQLTRDLGLGYTVLRLRRAIDATGWHEDTHFVTFQLDLSGGPDAVWRDQFRDKTRNQVRKAQRYSFDIRAGHEQLDAAVDVLHRGIKALGSPSPGRALFEHAIAAFRENVDFLVVYDGPTPAAATALFYFNGTVAHSWCVALQAYREQCVNQLLYWEIIRQGCARGMQRFDLGRSHKAAGTYQFKKHLRAAERQLHYYYFLGHRRQPPRLDPTNPSPTLAAATRVWRHLPDVLSRRLSPLLLKQLV